MTKTEGYRQRLRQLDLWDSYLLRESGLPGPRANLELSYAVAEEGNRELFERYITFTPERAPANSKQEFLAICGVVGLGRLLAEGDRGVLEVLRACARDPRWRIREAVAMALQRLGDVDMDALLREMQEWSKGSLLEQRAAAASLCEPRLLREREVTRRVLQTLDSITASIGNVEDRKSEAFKALKKGLGYCWSVAVAALPAVGKEMM